jgi:four helix bundle protein
MQEPQKIRSFTDLLAWKEAHKLALTIYQITDKFPDKEIYSLVSQMRRCSVSVASNIAEGFSRQGVKEKIQFFYMAKGSLTELQSQLLIAKDLKYLSKEGFDDAANKTVLASKLILGLIKSLRNR